MKVLPRITVGWAVADVFGKDYMDKVRWQSYKNVAYAETMDDEPLQSGLAGSQRFYDKGAWLLYMLRGKVGDACYRSAIVKYLDDHARGVVTSPDFIGAMENECGLDLEKYFSQWLYSSGMPIFNFKATYDEEYDQIDMMISQEQKITYKTKPFHFTIPVWIKTNKELYQMDYEIVSEIKKMQMLLTAGEKVEYVVVDPNFATLVDWQYEMPESWKIQNGCCRCALYCEGPLHPFHRAD